MKIKQNATNADLWMTVQHLVRQLGQRLQVLKLTSHQDQDTAQDEAEAWLFKGNGKADLLAQTMFSRHVEFFHRWKQLQDDITAIHVMRNQVHDTFIAVAQVAVQSPGTQKPQEDKQHANRINISAVEEVSFQPLAEGDLGDSYTCAEVQRIAEWLQTVCDPSEPLQALAWFQLNVLYEFQTYSRGVKYNKIRKRWDKMLTVLHHVIL